MTRRTQSSSCWLEEHFSDLFVKCAQAEGWRSRAVFKLEEADKKEHLLRRGQVLDLGAAPGAWSQCARAPVRQGSRAKVKPQGKVIASDILPMDVLAGVEFVQGDIREEAVFGQRAELALEMAGKVLKPGGSALIKVFQGTGFQELTAAVRRHFRTVRFLKPAVSRARSAEIYLLASGQRLV